VFLGPTLAKGDASAILDAAYLPPAREADVLSAVTTFRPRVIGIIDGAFGQSLSVWHKEILFALEQGVHVFGASSLGALRAAETSMFGTVGIGEVYRMYATGELEDDDEVAVAHAGADNGYKPVSEPMVNLRKSFLLAAQRGVCSQSTCEQLITIAKGLYFAERTRLRVFAEALKAGVAPSAVAAMQRFIENSYVDVKRNDAILLLTTIRDLPSDLPPLRPDFTLNRPHFFAALYDRDRTVRHDGVEVSLHAIADFAALHLEDFGRINFNALNRAFAVEIAGLLGIQPVPDQVAREAARLRRRHGLERQEDFNDWLARNDLSLDEWHTLTHDLALCRRLHAWLIVRKRAARTTRAVLDELRLIGRYAEVAHATAAHEKVIQAVGTDALISNPSDEIGALMHDHLQHSMCDADIELSQWSEEVGFATLADLRVELLRARQVRDRFDRAAEVLTGLVQDETSS
jgi:hypothetical protein